MRRGCVGVGSLGSSLLSIALPETELLMFFSIGFGISQGAVGEL